ncbi:MAG: aspartate carbamoyltransferase catalytic subunit [SAR202 cluster bacterium]|nr:aspartate carbamoyltransferase catalytic subunit [SAR202 cluster bacterium]MDP6662821.1 aspartate carbamoyltransferase catalytic subunit [SAR202 cluster bacterium]MDP6800955.1 aspartate carbamoyltransferase catalytic subunit [SAR202 cluster bacterium]
MTGAEQTKTRPGTNGQDSSMLSAPSPTGPVDPPSTAARSGRRHVLDMDDFSREEILGVFQNADAMTEVLNRDIKKVPTLRGKTVVTLFYEASTRTRVSFEQAGKVLSADVINVSASSSSANKGESLYNTALTLQAMNADIIVIRHGHSGAPHFLARHLDSCVINAGDGTHAHPTQALLDLYTIHNHLGDIDGIKVAIVGDALYSRVARSNLWGLTTMGAQVTLCAPPTLMPVDFLDGRRSEEGHPFASVRVESNVERAIEDADVVMVLRLQLERQHAGHLPTLREYSRMYGINERRLVLAKPGALVMHPGPMNEGVEIDPEVAHGARSVIEEQVSNGVAIRMALLYGMATPARQNAATRGG